MDTQVTLFNFNGADLRTVMHNGDPWFVATDVAEALDLTDGKTSIRRLDPDEVHTMPLLSAGGTQNTTIISESGLYSLTLRSRRPEAKRFKKWVTSEVLPTIRKTGAYIEPGVDLAPMTVAPSDVPAWVQQLMMAIGGKTIEVEAIATRAVATANAAASATATQSKQIEAMRAEMDDRDLGKRQQLRREVELIKRQVFKAMTERGMGIQKVAHDFWEAVKGRAGVSSVKVECLTVSMAHRLFVEAQKQAAIWGVSIVVNLPLQFDESGATG
jgi:prophage antirepressor-like protein